MKNKNTGLLFALLLGCPLVLSAETSTKEARDDAARARMGQVEERANFHKLVDISSEVYGALTKGPHGEVPESVLENAKCIAVIPNVMTGALLLGGTRGEGLASCKNVDDDWSQPAPVSLSQGSLGLQAGVKSADIVLFIQSNEAVKALKKGEFALGADVSAVAGSFDKSLDTSKAGVVVYSRSEGLFAGAAVNGSKIGKNESEIENYYGKKIDHTALLEGRESPDTAGYSMKLTKLLP